MEEYRMVARCAEWDMDWLLGSQRVPGWHAEGCAGGESVAEGFWLFNLA